MTQEHWPAGQAVPDGAGVEGSGVFPAPAVIHDPMQFFNIASDMLLTTRADGYIGTINGACQRVLGWTPDEITGMALIDLVHPDDLAATVALRDPMLRGEEVTGFENRFRHKDGSYRWLSWRYRYDAASRLVYACANDITERKTYQAELERTVNRFNLAMSATHEGVWDLDLVTNEVCVSTRYKQILGYSDADAPQTAAEWSVLCDPEDYAAARSQLSQYLDGLVPEYRTTFRMRHKAGGWRTILSRGVALRDEAGRAYRMVGVHADVTEQREAEDHLHWLKSQAEAANQAKTDFLTNMSHEIRTPMNAVVGAAHILSFGALTPEKHKQVVDVLMQGANSLMGLIEDLLDISKIEARALELEQSEFDAREVVAEVVRMVEMQAAAKGLSIQQQNRCACVAERLFLGDRKRIRQILLNLCSNAVKFTEAGTITVAITCQPTAAPGVEELRFLVSDTGIGVPQDKLDAIFGTFVQGDATLSRRHGGSGLGLSIAKSLAEAMGGSITAQSDIGIGSSFAVRLPLQRVGASMEAAAVQVTAAATVLLVEDNPGNIMVASHFLEDFGYRYDVATTGEDALARIEAGARYQAILMDVQMPGMDGRETTRRIRYFERALGLAPCPIIAMTAHAQSSDREQCLAAGMDDYIAKPFDPANLKAKLTAAVDPAQAGAEVHRDQAE